MHVRVVPWRRFAAAISGCLQGHAQITTTQKYLHALPDADQKNLDALDRIRGSGPRPDPDG